MGAGKGKNKRVQGIQEANILFNAKIKKPLVKTMVGLSLAGVIISSSGCGNTKPAGSAQQNTPPRSTASISANPQAAAALNKQVKALHRQPTINHTNIEAKIEQTKAHFVTQANAIRDQVASQGSPIREKINAIDQNDPDFNKKAGNLYAKLSTILQQSLPQMEALKSPPGDEASIAHYKEVWRERSMALDAYVAAGSGGSDVETLSELMNKINRSTVELNEWEKSYSL